MAKRKIVKQESTEKYVPRKTEYYFYIGDKYYRRLQPTPYAHNIQNIKEKLGLWDIVQKYGEKKDGI
jgi:hypothetical protein